MKVLLVGEASGVHRNLKKGLVRLGADCTLITQSSSTSWKWYDDTFSPHYEGALGGIARNVAPFKKILGLSHYDVINYVNTITAVHGTITKYYDLPLMRRKTSLMSYYALGCDEIGLLRRNETLTYSPCTGCLSSKDTLSRDCEGFLNKQFDISQQRVRKYFDFGSSSVAEYGHVEPLFEDRFARIQFPVDAELIAFEPAGRNRIPKIVHTPTRRGFKGTPVVLEAMELLKARRKDYEFAVIEGLEYAEYLRTMATTDIVIDQVYSHSPGMNALEMLASGKIVLTGASELGRSYYPFMNDCPVFDAPPNPAELADQLSHLLDRQKEFSQLAERGRNFVLTHHSPYLVAEKFHKAWSEQLSHAGARARRISGSGT